MSKPIKSVFDGHEVWHNACGGYAGSTRAQVEKHLRECREKGRVVHFHVRENKSDFTATMIFRRPPEHPSQSTIGHSKRGNRGKEK